MGAITVFGDRFVSRFDEYVTSGHVKHFLLALCEEFDEDLIVVLDGTPYFRASVVTVRQVRDDITSFDYLHIHRS
ncbi:hypothetical protein GCM10009000_077390 [Halobacterium noricense]|uniref:Tc1-like transposase DDE domain-containing protein n=1 Tax=Haladaptatus pallidirubidus TaxID=1008152 RepID=A0AAV3UQB5_9EURY